MSGPKFVLRALGGLSMKRIDGNTPVLVDQRKRLGLLAVIAAAGSAGVTRDRLLAFLWPESDDAHARNALNQLVYAIRRDLGSDVSMEADGALSLCAETIESDIERFRAARARGAFLEAVELYAGPFLDGVYLRDVPDFERWVEESRRSFADGYSDALDRLVISALASGEMVRAAHWARALVAHDPLNTRYALRLIQVLDTNGERAAAIRHAELHGLLLKQELGLDLPVDLVDAVRRLRDHRAGGTSLSDGAIVKSVVLGTEPVAISGREPSRRRYRVPLIAAGVSAAGALALWAAVVAAERVPRGIRVGALSQIVVANGGPAEPAISPDGKWVAFTANPPGTPAPRLRSGIYVRQIGGSQVIAVATDSTLSFKSPVWSPDGSRLAFQTRSKSSAEVVPTAIQTVDALGGTPERLVSDPVGKRFLEVGGWSHDGTRLAFADTAGVWIYNLRTGRSDLLLHTTFVTHSLTWAPGDSIIAYVVGSGGLGNLAPSAIWLARLPGGKSVQVTDALHFNASPSFTPDGKKLVFVSNRDGARDIYEQPLVNGASSPRAVRLTTGSNAVTISLSADGRSMVYGSYVMRSNIWSAPIYADRESPITAARQITFGDQEVECMNVSNDGEWLLYDSNLKGNEDIYKTRIAGGEPVQLTSDPADDFCPAMSPDGEEIGFYSLRRGGVRRVFTMRSSGAGQRPVVLDSPEEHQFGPSWRADGNALAFQAARGGARHVDMVFRDSIGTWGGLRHLIDVGGATWSPDGKLLVTGGEFGIAVSTPDGNNRRVIVPRGRLSAFFSSNWGPSSDVLFFKTEADRGVSLFWSVPTKGGEPRLLLRVGDALHTSRTALFASDGKRLYFTLSNDEVGIWRLDLVP